MSFPTFSVVIPVHNRQSLILRAIDSVINQTFADFEVVVVDDASTDNTTEVVRGRTDPRIKLIRLETNQGPSGARNAGFMAAHGQFVSLLDSDDEMHPKFLEKTYCAFKDSAESIGFSWTGKRTVRREAEGFQERVRITESIWKPQFKTREEAVRYCLSIDPPWGTSGGVTFRKGVLESIGGFDTKMRAREDVDILFRLLERYDYIVLPEILMTLHNDAETRVDGNVNTRAEAYILMYHKYHSWLQSCREAERFFNTIIVNSLIEGGRRIEALRWLVKRFICAPADLWLLRQMARASIERRSY